MANKVKWFLDKLKDYAKEKAKEWIGFDEFIDDLKNDQNFNIEIENHLSQNQSQSIVNNSGVDHNKHIKLLEENSELKEKVRLLENNSPKIKITKEEYELYKIILEYQGSIFEKISIPNMNNEIFGRLRFKEIIKPYPRHRDYFEIVVFEKDLEIKD